MPGFSERYEPEERGSERMPLAVQKMRIRYHEESQRVIIVFRFQQSICSVSVSLDELADCGLITIQDE